MAKKNPFRFSTKYADNESGLLYYGYRYYNPSAGRWLSRDPIGERDALNVYQLVGNDPLSRWDYLGLKCCLITYAAGGGYAPHSILKCDNGVYISAFPSGRPICSPPEWREPEPDAKYFKNRVPTITCTDCLDEVKVKAWLDNAKKQNQDYKVFSRNCADITMQAIASGLPDEKKPSCKTTCWERIGGFNKVLLDKVDYVTEFVRRNLDALTNRPSALFSVSLAAHGDPDVIGGRLVEGGEDDL